MNMPPACPPFPGPFPPQISLRDWFAGCALAGILARNYPQYVQVNKSWMDAWTAGAYEVAEAMLKARAQ